jgi:hypothetical protein
VIFIAPAICCDDQKYLLPLSNVPEGQKSLVVEINCFKGINEEYRNYLKI